MKFSKFLSTMLVCTSISVLLTTGCSNSNEESNLSEVQAEATAEETADDFDVESYLTSVQELVTRIETLNSGFDRLAYYEQHFWETATYGAPEGEPIDSEFLCTTAYMMLHSYDDLDQEVVESYYDKTLSLYDELSADTSNSKVLEISAELDSAMETIKSFHTLINAPTADSEEALGDIFSTYYSDIEANISKINSLIEE